MNDDLFRDLVASFEEAIAHAEGTGDRIIIHSVKHCSDPDFDWELFDSLPSANDIDIELATSTFTKMGNNDFDNHLLSKLTFDSLPDDDLPDD
jgi:hypothetical protein